MFADNVEKVLISEEEIVKRCKELGAQISKDYAGKNPMIIGLLKGSVPFMAELIKNIDIDCTIDFMAVSSYSGLESMGDVKIVKDLDTSIKDVNVLVVEDIVDTGRTLKQLKKILSERNPKSIKICTAFDKPSRRVTDLVPDYNCFTIPDKFIVGYGLDYDGKYRDYKDVRIVRTDDE
jgi:hypoxanthine phosphoribosyltransferase